MDRHPLTPSFASPSTSDYFTGTTHGCPQCKALQAEIDVLKDENNRLKAKLNAKLKEEDHIMEKRCKIDKVDERSVGSKFDDDDEIYSDRQRIDELSTALLTQTPTVVELVFRYLNAQQLRWCASVCLAWRRTANVVKRRRRDPVILFRTAPRNYKGRNSRPFDVGSLIQTFKEKLLSCYSERDIGVVFFANMGFEDVRQVENFLQAVESSPAKLNYFSVNYYHLGNLIGLDDASQWGNWPPDMHPRVPGMSAVFFPDNIPGVQFFPFKILDELPDAPHSAIPLLTGIPQGTKVKCLLIFKASPFCVVRTNLAVDPARAIMDYYVEQCPLALGGTQAGFVHYINEVSRNPDEFGPLYIGCGLAFAGDNFDAGSVLIAPGVRTKEVVTRFLIELKGKITLRSNSLAFLFTSATTEGDYYMQRSMDVESACFREVFPDVPFLGMKSHGMYNTREIIGTKYFPEGKNVVIPPCLDVFIHHQSAAVVLITWGILPDSTGACTTSSSYRKRHPKYNCSKRS